MSKMVLDRVCGTIGLEDPDVRDAISTLDDIAKDASENGKKVKLETRESVPEFAWTASLLVEMHKTKCPSSYISDMKMT